MRIAPGKVIAAAVIAIVALICFVKMAHVNDVQNLQIIQSVTGQVTVRKQAGWYFMMCPRIWKYSKAGVYQLNSEDKDLLDIQFKNKSTAKLKANIGYRIDGASDETLIALHQQVEGDDEKIWKMLLTALNTTVQSITTKYDPSDVIGGDKFEPMIKEIATNILHNPELMAHGIDVNYFAVDGRPLPDKDTEEQFNRQKEADLARRLAEAEKIKLESETLKTEANYKREIAEFKGKADAETAKLKTEAEREKELATIAAQKQVEVAKLEKERAVIEVERQKEVAKVEAEKALAVAEVQKQTEKETLEAIKLKAEQRVAEAEAKKVAIEKSGAITELQQAELDLQRAIAQYKWESIGKAIAGVKLPTMMNIGSGVDGKNGVSALDQFIQLLTAEKLGAITPAKVTPAPKAPATK